MDSNLNIVDIDKLNQYIDFCIDNSTISKHSEKHHILPKAPTLFPQFKSFKEHPWNCVTLTYKDHYIAHALLAEAIKEPAITFAWHSMNSVNYKNDGVSIIGEDRYESLRKRHRDAVVHYNKTRVLSEETRRKNSESQKKLRNGKTFFDSTGLVTVFDNVLKKFTSLTLEEYYNNDRYTHITKDKVTVRFWDGSYGQMSKDDFENNHQVGGTTSKRYIITDDNGNVTNTMKYDKFIKENNLPKTFKKYAGKGIIEGYNSVSNQFGSRRSINGWLIECLD